MKWKPNTKRPRGYSRQRWKVRMVKDLKKLGIENGKELGGDRPVEAMGLNGLKKNLKRSWYLTVLGSGSVL